MQDKKNPDRRHNKIRHNRSTTPAFEISLLDKDGKTINVSASGICFEVPLKDVEAFSLGTTIPLQINTVTNTPESLESKHNLGGKGVVIRNWVIENTDRANSMGVALEFTEKLNIVINNDSL